MSILLVPFLLEFANSIEFQWRLPLEFDRISEFDALWDGPLALNTYPEFMYNLENMWNNFETYMHSTLSYAPWRSLMPQQWKHCALCDRNGKHPYKLVIQRQSSCDRHNRVALIYGWQYQHCQNNYWSWDGFKNKCIVYVVDKWYQMSYFCSAFKFFFKVKRLWHGIRNRSNSKFSF